MNMIVAFRAVSRRIWFHSGQRSFRDALRQWYAKELRGIPSQFTFGQQCNANHALNCKMGGFLTIRHNYIRDYEVNLHFTETHSKTSNFNVNLLNLISTCHFLSHTKDYISFKKKLASF